MLFYFYLVVVYVLAIALGRLKASVPDAAVKAAVIILIITISYWGAEEVYMKTFLVFLFLSFIAALVTVLLTYGVGFVWRRRFQFSKSKNIDIREFVTLFL